MIDSDLVNVNKASFITRSSRTLRHLSKATSGLNDSGCRASYLNAVSSISRLSILHSLETTSSISETVSVTVEDSE